MRAAFGVLLAALILAGCAGSPSSAPAACNTAPSKAIVYFSWDGDAATLREALAELGWRVEETRTPIGFPALRLVPLEGEPVFVASFQEDVSPSDGPFSVNVVFEGYHGEYAGDEARATLGPLAEPFVERFGATVQYMGAFNSCDIR